MIRDEQGDKSRVWVSLACVVSAAPLVAVFNTYKDLDKQNNES